MQNSLPSACVTLRFFVSSICCQSNGLFSRLSGSLSGWGKKNPTVLWIRFYLAYCQCHADGVFECRFVAAEAATFHTASSSAAAAAARLGPPLKPQSRAATSVGVEPLTRQVL